MTPNEFLPKYFIQSTKWLKFWKDANNSLKTGHDYRYYENTIFECHVYIYPYILGTKFWYISKGFNFKKGVSVEDRKAISKSFIELLEKIKVDAKKESGTHLKFDLDDNLTKLLGVHQNNQPQIIEWFRQQSNLKPVVSNKKIQYLVSSYNNIEHEKIDFSNQDSLQEFYNKTLDIFWSKCNEKIRRYTRKAIKLTEKENFWNYSLEKSEDDFDKFYKIHIETTKRQGFPTQPKSYLKDLFFADFTQAIIINDEVGNPHCVWLGIMLENQLVYLLGGNTELSFKKYAQYLVHVLALRICVENKVDYYDMGGYDPNEGYGKFKDGYRGTVREFKGVFDIVLNKPKYYGIKCVLKVKNFLKR